MQKSLTDRQTENDKNITSLAEGIKQTGDVDCTLYVYTRACLCVRALRSSIGPALGVKRQSVKPTGYNVNPAKKSLLDSVDEDPLWQVATLCTVTCRLIVVE